MLLLRLGARCAPSPRIAARPPARRTASSAPAPAPAAAAAAAAPASGIDLSMATPIDVGLAGSSRVEQAVRARYSDAPEVQEEATAIWQHVWTAAVERVNQTKDLSAKERQDWITELSELAKSTPPPDFADSYVQTMGLASVLAGPGDDIADENPASSEPELKSESFTDVSAHKFRVNAHIDDLAAVIERAHAAQNEQTK